MITKDSPGVEIELTALEEHIDPAEHFASGDDAEDEAMVAEIKRRSDGGDIWAWFAARVRVTYQGISEEDHLGACSYASEADFRSGDYFDDMVSTCIDQINAQLQDRAPLTVSLPEMTSKFAGGLSQMDRDMAVRKVAAEVGASTNYGARYEYTTCGDQLALAIKSADGYTRVFDCRVLRCATFRPDGTQIVD